MTRNSRPPRCPRAPCARFGILVAAQQMTPDELLIIEEPEVSIHVGAAQLLFDVLKDASRRGAVLVTTHSADLLDAARDEEILVCSYRDGVTKIGPLATGPAGDRPRGPVLGRRADALGAPAHRGRGPGRG